MSLTASGPKLNLPVVSASGAVPAAAVPVVAAPVVANGPKSMLNTAKRFLGLGGARRRSRGRKAVTRRRRGRKAVSRRVRAGRRVAGSRRH